MKRIILAGLILALVGCSDDKSQKALENKPSSTTATTAVNSSPPKTNDKVDEAKINAKMDEMFPKFKVGDIISYPDDGYVCFSRNALSEASDYLYAKQTKKFSAMFQNDKLDNGKPCIMVPAKARLKIVSIDEPSEKLQVMQLMSANKQQGEIAWGLNINAKLEKSK